MKRSNKNIIGMQVAEKVKPVIGSPSTWKEDIKRETTTQTVGKREKSTFSANINRILMTTDTVGGVWNYSVELAEELVKYGMEVILASMGGKLSPECMESIQSKKNIHFYQSDFKLEWMKSPWEDVEKAGNWLKSIEKETHPEVVHLNGYAHAALKWNCPVLVVGHSCVCSWYAAVKKTIPGTEWDRYRENVSRGLSSAGLVTAPSWAMLESLRLYYGTFSAAAPVYNGRNRENFYPRNKEPFIFSAGRLWDKAKNIQTLEKAATYIKWPVHVAGENSHPEGGESNFEGINVVGNLKTAELAEWMGRAAVFALPARYEPFGLSILEAALSGCALVLGDIPSLREIWGEEALYVHPENPDGLAAILDLLMTNPELREEMAVKAMSRALIYTPERMAEDYVTIYGRLLGTRVGLNPGFLPEGPEYYGGVQR